MSTPWIILSEGDEDAAFFKNLIKVRAIPNMEIKKRPNNLEGNTVFRQWLMGLKPGTGYDKHSGILIVGDNDNDPATSFRKIKRQIEEADGYGVPSAPRQVAPAQNNLPPVAVLMIPWDDKIGALETLCLTAGFTQRPQLEACVTRFVKCVKATKWDISKLSKLRMRCFLSAACPGDPNTGLKFAWTGDQRPSDLIPLDNPCFDQIAKYLADLP